MQRNSGVSQTCAPNWFYAGKVPPCGVDLRAGTETHWLRSMLKRSVSCERLTFFFIYTFVNVFTHSPGAPAMPLL